MDRAALATLGIVALAFIAVAVIVAADAPYTPGSSTIAYYEFNEGWGNTTNSSDNPAFAAALKEISMWSNATKRFGHSGLQFDGPGGSGGADAPEAVNITNATQWLISNGTIQLWLMVNETPGAAGFIILDSSPSVENTGRILLSVRSNMTVSMMYSSLGYTFVFDCNESGTMLLNAWYNITAQWNETDGIRVYVNDSLCAINYTTMLDISMPIAKHISGYLGSHRNYGGSCYDNCFSGFIDELHISNTSIPITDIGGLSPPAAPKYLYISILSPENTTYTSSNATMQLNFNWTYTAEGIINETLYSIDGSANQSLTGNLTLQLAEGPHIIILWANLTTSQHNTTQVMFNIQYPPSITSTNLLPGCISIPNAALLIWEQSDNNAINFSWCNWTSPSGASTIYQNTLTNGSKSCSRIMLQEGPWTVSVTVKDYYNYSTVFSQPFEARPIFGCGGGSVPPEGAGPGGGGLPDILESIGNVSVITLPPLEELPQLRAEGLYFFHPILFGTFTLFHLTLIAIAAWFSRGLVKGRKVRTSDAVIVLSIVMLLSITIFSTLYARSFAEFDPARIQSNIQALLGSVSP